VVAPPRDLDDLAVGRWRVEVVAPNPMFGSQLFDMRLTRHALVGRRFHVKSELGTGMAANGQWRAVPPNVLVLHGQWTAGLSGPYDARVVFDVVSDARLEGTTQVGERVVWLRNGG
jgi:hypothetical protein